MCATRPIDELPAFLSPLAPTPTVRAPHGDPGERIAGDTLADVYPRMLDRILTCGREIPSQYGVSRELMGLVTVIRNPSATVVDIMADDDPEAMRLRSTPHPILGFSWEALLDYAKTFPPNTEMPEGASYGYGARMGGLPTGVKINEVTAEAQFDEDTDPLRLLLQTVMNPNQLAAISNLLATHPDTRAAYLSPWRPEEDAGLESGRPCMVGAWFRMTGDRPDARCYVCNAPATCEAREGGGLDWAPMCDKHCGIDPEDGERSELGRVLHLTVIFRSHDMMRDWALDLAAACLWLVSEAEKHGTQIGTLTCVSLSAWLHERDWVAAQDVVARAGPGPTTTRDRRSCWRVQAILPRDERSYAVGDVATDTNGTTWRCDLTDALDRWCIGATPIRETTASGMVVDVPEGRGKIKWLEERDWYAWRNEAAPSPVIRATALSPDGTETLGTFEASTPGALLLEIGRSGLVTSIEHALVIGGEIERVWRGEK